MHKQLSSSFSANANLRFLRASSVYIPVILDFTSALHLMHPNSRYGQGLHQAKTPPKAKLSKAFHQLGCQQKRLGKLLKAGNYSSAKAPHPGLGPAGRALPLASSPSSRSTLRIFPPSQLEPRHFPVKNRYPLLSS
ncbi:hypothetical protein AVEN_34091-1 [Araneus ventricosus]|uniref:Uncharacterized protein n=1 Tax=Araneus ventricosus TaxID=182803 RepID=A0A4Y2ASZ8_ARAVE|nr:hypothetical protein AVEN_34091-1 [Araneus ventricosus]